MSVNAVRTAPTWLNTRSFVEFGTATTPATRSRKRDRSITQLAKNYKAKHERVLCMYIPQLHQLVAQLVALTATHFLDRDESFAVAWVGH